MNSHHGGMMKDKVVFLQSFIIISSHCTSFVTFKNLHLRENTRHSHFFPPSFYCRLYTTYTSNASEPLPSLPRQGQASQIRFRAATTTGTYSAVFFVARTISSIRASYARLQFNFESAYFPSTIHARRSRNTAQTQTHPSLSASG